MAVIRVSPTDLARRQTTLDLGFGLRIGVGEDGVPRVYYSVPFNRWDRYYSATWPAPHAPIWIEPRAPHPACVICLAGATDEDVAAATIPEFEELEEQ